jgi:cell division protein FtsL
VSAGPAPARRARAPHPHRAADERLRRAAVAAPPRRVSGPARPRAVPAPAPPPFGRWADGLRALPDARWVERLLRGRAWIALIAVALIGIVAMQVHLLKLNAGIGRAVETTATLERQNAVLRSTVAGLSARERIQAEAAEMGLAMPPAGDVRYVRARGPRDVRSALKTMRAPDPPAPVATAEATALAAPGAVTGSAAADPTVAAVAPVDGATADPAATVTEPTVAPADPAATAVAPAAPTVPVTPAVTPEG